jgi:hypothetical protein
MQTSQKRTPTGPFEEVKRSDESEQTLKRGTRIATRTT